MPQSITTINVTVDASLLTELRENLKTAFVETTVEAIPDADEREAARQYIKERIDAVDLILDLIDRNLNNGMSTEEMQAAAAAARNEMQA